MFIGDSFVRGVGDEAGLGWVGRICEAANLTYVNEGVAGDTSVDILGRLEDVLAKNTADKLVFSFGANDCLLNEHRRVRVTQVERLKNAKKMMQQGARVGKVLFISPFPIAENEIATRCIADTARQLGVVAKMNKTPYVNVFNDVASSEVWKKEAMAGDGAHPNAKSYELVAGLISAHKVWQDFIAD